VEIRVLGCHGSQMPGCNTTSFLLNGKVLIDAGTITTLLTVEEQHNIDDILVTHAHLDHVKDIMFLADNLCYIQQDRPLMIYGTSRMIEAIRTHLFNGIIWPDFSTLPSPESPVLNFVEIRSGEKVRLGDLDVTAIPVHHVVETVGYAVESREGSVVFIGDTGPTEEIWEVANRTKNLKAVFIETSLPDDMREIADITGHLTPSTLRQELKKLKGAHPDIYLYHMKLQYQKAIQREIALIENRNIHMLRDGQIIRF
jgi:ribonuclease BN (tRNA processing enzyme)